MLHKSILLDRSYVGRGQVKEDDLAQSRKEHSGGFVAVGGIF